MDFDYNEHCCSLSVINFSGYDEDYICVGTVKDLKHEP